MSSAISTLAAGAVLASISTVFFQFAHESELKVDKYHELWLDATNPGEIEKYRDKGEEAQQDQDRQTILGAVFISVGGAAIATGVVLFCIMPVIPEEPNQPPKKARKYKAGIKITPVLTGNSGGISVVGRF